MTKESPTIENVTNAILDALAARELGPSAPVMIAVQTVAVASAVAIGIDREKFLEHAAMAWDAVHREAERRGSPWPFREPS